MRRFQVPGSRGQKKNLILWMTILSIGFAFCGSAYSVVERGSMASIDRSILDGNYDKAVTDATSLINARSCNCDELYYARGIANLKLNKFDQARNDLNTVISKYPKSSRMFDAYMGIGDSYFLEGNSDQAAKSYEVMLGKFSEDKNISIVYYKLGCSYRKSGTNPKADEYFEKAKRASPLGFESHMIPAATYSQPAKIVPQSPTGNFSVQVGSFKNKDNAEKLSHKLTADGYDNFIEQAADGLYRVKAGRYNSRNEAENTASILKGRGYSTNISSVDASQ